MRGPAIVSGYYANAAASRKQIDAEGWFATGDVAKITPDGWLLIVDRTKDLVKSGGEWISSIDVENAALAVKGIANCAVIGVPHPKWGEAVMALVVPRAGQAPTAEELTTMVAERKGKFQAPKVVEFIDAIPQTAVGKPDKKALRARFGQRAV